MIRVLAAVTMLFVSAAVHAQGIKSCDAFDTPDHHWQVVCVFSPSSDENSVPRLKAYLFDPVAGRIVPSVLADPSRDGFSLTMQEMLDPKRTYLVFAMGTTVQGKSSADVTNGKVTFHAATPADAGKTGAASATKQASALESVIANVQGADSKEKADLYFSGTIWAVGGQDWSWAGSVDLKIQRPFSVGNTRFDHQFGPSLTLQSSNDPSADPDSLKYGVQWSGRLIGIHGRFKGMFAKEDLRMDTTPDFSDRNFISEPRFTFALPTLASARKNRRGYLEPFVGVEAGRNIEAPLATVDGTGRARPLAGVSFALAFTKVPHLQSISITSDYVRRWLLETELGYHADSKNVLHLTSVGTAPKDRVTSKINFMMKDWLGISFGHDYGSEPPAFKLIDNKLTLGLVIQAKFGSAKTAAK